jgi:ankyrin repeat protein
MCALFALKFSTSDIVADFEMKTNSDDCGDFDDVVLKVTFVDGQSEMFLLQLKHSENMKKVTEKKLAATNGDFSLPKYIKSIRNFENTKNVSFILYTNLSTSIESSSKFSLQIENMKNKIEKKEEIVVKELQDLDSKKLLLINKKEISDKKEGTKVFQFKLNQSSGSVEALGDYLKGFYFFAQQTNTTGAQSLINAMLKEKCGIADVTYSSSFIQFMETWWSGNFILTKYDVVAKLAELTLTPFIQTISDRKCNEKSKLLREAIMKFDMMIVRDTNEEIIANIWNETASDDEISFTSLKYGLRFMGFKDLPSKARSKVLWHLNKIPLIVKAEKCHETQVKHAIRLLEKVEKKKVVLLGNATKEEFPGWKIFQDLSDLPNEGVYADIIKHFAVSLQGRPPIFLDQLLNFDQGNDRTIETTELIKMTQEVIQIGGKQEEAFETYIPRSVSTITLNITKMLQSCKIEDSLLIICNVSQPWNEAIRQLDLHVMELDQYLEERKKCDVLLTNNKWPQVPFNDICEKTKRNVHLLQVFDDKSCTSVLSKKKIFSMEIMKSEGARVDEMEIFTYLDHPLNVICSPPGMGKSTLVSRLSTNCPSSYWSVRVNLINHKRVLKKERDYDKILHHFVQEEEDPFVVKIRSMLLKNKRMYLFLDGLDEIDSDCLQVVLDAVKHISSLGHRVWITSRENLEQTASRSLNIFPIKIEELIEEQQKAYIQKRLQNMYQEDEVEHITNKIYANVDIVNSRHLLGIPLQLFMVTENFRDNKNLWREPDQEIFVLTKMYKIFFQGKKMHQLRKVGVHEHEDQIGFDFDLYLEQYELPALKSCLDTTTFDKLKINLGKSQNFLEKLKTGDPFGIVSGVTDDNQVIFSHQTYAEYFACAWLKNNLDKVSLLQDDLFTKKNQNLKFMFDIMLAEKSALHLAVIYRDTDVVLKHLDKSEVKDEGGRSPLQLLCTYGVEHPRLWKQVNTLFSFYKKEHVSYNYYDENYIEEVSTQYKEIFKMLSHCNVFQNDDIFEWNCLDYAVQLHNLFAVEKLLERFGESINLEKLFKHYGTITLAYYSSQLGYLNLLRAAIRKDSKVPSVKFGTCNLTLLHVAIIRIKRNNKFGEIKIEEIIKGMTALIERGLDVNSQCGCERTPLHLASELDDEAIVKFLLERGANINLTDDCRRNALHYALRNYKVNMRIVKLLIDKGIDTKAKDKNGRTALHLCCIKGYYDPLVMLLNHGRHAQVATKKKRNFLHKIFRQSKPNKEIMSSLISKGAEVNGKDVYGCTPLHYACDLHSLESSLLSGEDVNATNDNKKKKNHPMKIISLLLENGANVNAKDSVNRSVLHYTAIKRNYDCIKVLLDHGADINAVCDFGKTVLHEAFEETYYLPDVEVIQLLLSRGVDANKRDKEQKTALDYAVTRRGSENVEWPEYHHMLKVMFDARVHEQLVSTDYVTFLHHAVYDGNCVALELFLALGLDLNNIDVNNAEYPLYFAVENEHLRSDLLLKMTKFIRDHKTRYKKFFVENHKILEPLKEYFSNG